MQRRVFNRLDMSRTSMIWREDLVNDDADVFLANGSAEKHNRHTKPGAAGSMDTTARDWSRFLAAVVNGKFLSARGKAEMIRRQIPIDSVQEFPTLSHATTDTYQGIHLGYGIGWGVFDTPYGAAFFKEGHDDGTGNYALCIQPRKACILLLSNSDKAEGIYKALVDQLMGNVGLPWRWENYIPYDLPATGPGK
jgi:CubicO group peptidase (beta-lactamase class C family)